MDAIGLAGLIVGVVALGVPFAIETLKRPRIEIVPSEWRNQAFVQWTFATVRVRNKPLKAPFKWLLERQTAHGCRAEIEFYKWDSTAPFIRMHGRWSSSPEPLSLVPSSLTKSPPAPTAGSFLLSGPPVTGAPFTPVHPPVTGGTAPTFVTGQGTPALPAPLSSSASGNAARGDEEFKVVYDPSRDPGHCDVTPEGDGEEIAVAILHGEQMFAFCAESYNYPNWGNPAWQLEPGGTYKIVVRIHGPGVRKKRQFKLGYLTGNPSEFRPQILKKGDWND